jgi:hypothetical protein
LGEEPVGHGLQTGIVGRPGGHGWGKMSGAAFLVAATIAEEINLRVGLLQGRPYTVSGAASSGRAQVAPVWSTSESTHPQRVLFCFRTPKTSLSHEPPEAICGEVGCANGLNYNALLEPRRLLRDNGGTV